MLGTPVGSRQLVVDRVSKRLDEERKLWEADPWLPGSEDLRAMRRATVSPHVGHIAAEAITRMTDTQRTMDVLLGTFPVGPLRATSACVGHFAMRSSVWESDQ